MDNRESPIAPSVGRIVLVRGLTGDGVNPDHHYPGIITRVHTNNCINVTVFNEKIGGQPLNSIFYSKGQSNGPTWSWMEYQISVDKAQAQAIEKLAKEPEAPTEATKDERSSDGPVSNQVGFGKILEALELGKRCARMGWNGKGMWIYQVPAASYPAQTDAAKEHIGYSVPYGAYLAMKTADGTVVPWLASQTDTLAGDWTILP